MRPASLTRAARCLAGLLGALALQGCFDVKTVDPGPESMLVETDDRGMVPPEGNALGVSGVWYSYGDQYSTPARCTEWGGHAPEDCSAVLSPPPLPALAFVNVDGRMCTAGEAAKVEKCVVGAKLPCHDKADYANMWGAGIGLDFDLELGRDDSDQPTRLTDADHRHVWNPDAPGIIGIAFDLEMPDVGALGYRNLRVEFPMVLPAGTRLPTDSDPQTDPVWTVLADDTARSSDDQDPLPDGTTSEEYPGGSPFWGAPPAWGQPHNDASPVVQGHNAFLWRDVSAPPDAKSEYAFDRTRILGIQFHVPALSQDSARLPYAFCISNLAFLRE